MKNNNIKSFVLGLLSGIIIISGGYATTTQSGKIGSLFEDIGGGTYRLIGNYIKDGTVGTDELGVKSVTSDKISDNSVGNRELKNNEKLTVGGIDGLKLGNGKGISGNNFDIIGANKIKFNDAGEGLNFTDKAYMYAINSGNRDNIRIESNALSIGDSSYSPTSRLDVQGDISENHIKLSSKYMKINSTGDQIQDNTIDSTEIQNGTIKEEDLDTVLKNKINSDEGIVFKCNNTNIGKYRWDGYICRYLKIYSLTDYKKGTLYCNNEWIKGGSGYTTHYTCDKIVEKSIYNHLGKHECNPDHLSNDGSECSNVNNISYDYVWYR